MEGRDGAPRRVAYADPPYPGMAWMYRDQPSYAGEVDHVALVSQLQEFDGWALSTSEKTLQQVLALCPPGVRIAAWTKPGGISSKTRGPHNAWEPVIYMPARSLQPGKRDWICTHPARGGDSDLIGRKPIAFCVWLFELLGMLPGDCLADLFPGSGQVSRCWQALQPSSSGSSSDASQASFTAAIDVSPAALCDVSPGAGVDVSPKARSDVSLLPACDVSPRASSDAPRCPSCEGSCEPATTTITLTDPPWRCTVCKAVFNLYPSPKYPVLCFAPIDDFFPCGLPQGHDGKCRR